MKYQIQESSIIAKSSFKVGVKILFDIICQNAEHYCYNKALTNQKESLLVIEAMHFWSILIVAICLSMEPLKSP